MASPRGSISATLVGVHSYLYATLSHRQEKARFSWISREKCPDLPQLRGGDIYGSLRRTVMSLIPRYSSKENQHGIRCISGPWDEKSGYTWTFTGDYIQKRPDQKLNPSLHPTHTFSRKRGVGWRGVLRRNETTPPACVTITHMTNERVMLYIRLPLTGEPFPIDVSVPQ